MITNIPPRFLMNQSVEVKRAPAVRTESCDFRLLTKKSASFFMLYKVLRCDESRVRLAKFLVTMSDSEIEDPGAEGIVALC